MRYQVGFKLERRIDGEVVTADVRVELDADNEHDAMWRAVCLVMPPQPLTVDSFATVTEV